MPWSISERFGLLESVGDLTRSLEDISRRVSRTMDRAIRRLEGNPVRTPEKRQPETTLPVKKPAEVLGAIKVLALDAELAALHAIAETVTTQTANEASRSLKTLADDAHQLTRTVRVAVTETFTEPKKGERREPVSVSNLSGRVISFTEAARALNKSKENKRRA